MAEAIAQESCQFPFLLDEKPAVVPLRFGRRAVGRCARGTLWSRSLAHGGGARVGRPRWLRILTITGGSSMAARIFNAPQLGQCSISMSKIRLSTVIDLTHQLGRKRHTHLLELKM